MKTEGPVVEDWINSPINSAIGTLWLGGHLRNNSCIPQTKMRILGKYALILILEGEIYYVDGHKRQAELQSGQAIMVTPDLPHAYGSLSGQSWRQSYVIFDGAQFDLLQQSEAIRSRQPFWKPDSIQAWNVRLKNLLEQPVNLQGDQGIQMIGNFAHLLIEMMTENTGHTVGEKSWLQRSMQLLGEPQATGWLTPQDVASQVGLNYENFRKLFSQEIALPPAKYQRNRKIDRACAAIYGGATHFKQLAEELGFCDVYHFSKAFRQVKGIPPSTYRRTVSGK